MAKNLTIQEMAQKSGLSVHTLRYYEKAGLIEPGRNENGHRRYTEEDVELIHYLLCCKNTGMSIPNIKKFIDYLKLGDSSYPERIEILTAHKKVMETKIVELQQFLDVVNKKIAYYTEMANQRN